MTFQRPKLIVTPPDDYEHTQSELAAYTAKLKQHFSGFAGFTVMDPGNKEFEQPPEIGVNITNGYEWPGDGASIQFVDSFRDVEAVLRQLVPLVHGSDRYNAVMADKGIKPPVPAPAPAPVMTQQAAPAVTNSLPVRLRSVVHNKSGLAFVTVEGTLTLHADGSGEVNTVDGGRYMSSRITKSNTDPEELQMVLDPAKADGLTLLTVDLTRGKTNRLALPFH